MKYKFITFEGVEGSGKSTQSKKLYEFLLGKEIDTILTREPGGAKASELVRNILISEEIEKLEPKTELLLNFSARLEHVEKTIKPALEKNKVVISDRFFDSSYAYQGNAFGLEKSLIDEVRKISIGDFEPDITFLIDVPIEISFERIKNRSDNNRYEKLGFEFHQKVREGFLQLAKNHNRIILIDGRKNEKEIFNEIISFLF
ncbi:MAG: dTMP kinase [Pelagibacterales bacterium]|nr:dTMP kinase [Pelagibacterales bacterium]